MKSVVGIEVLANRIGMECNEEDLKKLAGTSWRRAYDKDPAIGL